MNVFVLVRRAVFRIHIDSHRLKLTDVHGIHDIPYRMRIDISNAHRMHSECTLSNVSNVSRSSDAKLRTDKAEKARTGTVAMAMATMVLKKRTRKNKLFHELFRIQKYSECVDQGLDQGVQTFPNY